MSVYRSQGDKETALRRYLAEMKESGTLRMREDADHLLGILNVPVAETPWAGEAPTGPSLPIDVEPLDMCVHVVLPGGAVLTLANTEPPTPQALEPFSERDKRIVRTLLLAASDELVGQYDYGYSYGAQQPMPAFPVAPGPVKP